MKKEDRTKILKIKIIISLVLVGLLLISFIFADRLDKIFGFKVDPSEHQVSASQIESSNYYVSYIDVGQGNSTFIKLPDGKTMLIDGGDISFGTTVAKYLDAHHVSSIDYLVASHSDSDHIGGLVYIMEHYEIKNVYRPFQLATENDGNTVAEYEQLGPVYDYLQSITGNKSKMSKVKSKIYRDFIQDIYTETYIVDSIEQSCKVTVFYDGLKISGENYEIEFFAPLKRAGDIDLESYTTSTSGFATVGYGTSEANDNSSILTVSCFDEKYLFMGDSRYYEGDSTATNYSELDFINSLTDAEKTEMAKVDVLMVGHHGSKYSTSRELLDMVLPRFVVVSCAAKNKYGHPHQEALDRIAETSGLEKDYLLRTDTGGDIEFSNVDGGIKYSLSKKDKEQSIFISYRVISTTVVVIVILTIFAINPRSYRARNRRRKNY